MDPRHLAAIAAAIAFPLATVAQAPPPPPPAGQELVPEPEQPVPPADDPTQPPPGPAEDQALWRAGMAVSDHVAVARVRANKLQWEGRQRSYAARLEALAQGEPGPKAERAKVVLARYAEVAAANYSTLTRQWPVDPTRGCRYQVLTLEGIMGSEDYKRKESHRAMIREDLQECVDRGEAAVKVMQDLNRELERVMADADAILPPIPIGTPPVLAPQLPGVRPVEKAPAAPPPASKG